MLSELKNHVVRRAQIAQNNIELNINRRVSKYTIRLVPRRNACTRIRTKRNRRNAEGAYDRACPNGLVGAHSIFPKKDGALRLCKYYRNLNDVNVSRAYLLPRMNECVDSLGDPRAFSALAANS